MGPEARHQHHIREDKIQSEIVAQAMLDAASLLAKNTKEAAELLADTTAATVLTVAKQMERLTITLIMITLIQIAVIVMNLPR